VCLVSLEISGAAHAQSAWARGDRAYRAGRFTEAETLYAQRARGGKAPPAVMVNLAATRARTGKSAEAEAGLRAVHDAKPPAGQTATYDLGTLLAGRGELDEALRELRIALERNPGDEDARFNYEWALRQRRSRQNPEQQPQQPRPQPSPSQPQQQTPQPQPTQPQQQPQNPGANPPPTPQRGQRMDRQQAERLLGSLEELERLEQQRLRRVRVMRERRGRDW
jgi:tetratricopeptide (TPR) repeat protein